MKEEEFKRRQAEMSNEELIELAEKEVSELARTYGKSHKMCIPPMVTDTDMILTEIIRRFKKILGIREKGTKKYYVIYQASGLSNFGEDKKQVSFYSVTKPPEAIEAWSSGIKNAVFFEDKKEAEKIYHKYEGYLAVHLKELDFECNM